MTRSLAATALPLLLVFSTSSLEAGQVTVKGAHLCCAACQGRAEKALEGLKGVSKKSVDRNAKVISFFAADEQAVTTGIAALAKSGFYGVTSHGKKPVQFPDSGAKRGVRSDKVLLMGVHLCCDACVVGAQRTSPRWGSAGRSKRRELSPAWTCWRTCWRRHRPSRASAVLYRAAIGNTRNSR